MKYAQIKSYQYQSLYLLWISYTKKSQKNEYFFSEYSFNLALRLYAADCVDKNITRGHATTSLSDQ